MPPRHTSPTLGLYSSFQHEPGTLQFVVRSTSDTPADFLDVSQALFACLSVIIGLLALVIGWLQLRRYRKHHALQDKDVVFELEAGYPTA
jgi:hypothetical protein